MESEIGSRDRPEGRPLSWTDGKVTSVTLSADDAIALGQSALQLSDRALRRKYPGDRGSVYPRMTADVRAAILNTDLHRSHIVLVLELQDGLQVSFSLPPEVSKPLAKSLPDRVSALEKASSDRSTSH